MVSIPASRLPVEGNCCTKNKNQKKIMTTILENNKNKRITGVIVMVCMISFGFVMQGCDNENEQINNLSINKVQVGDVFVEKSIAKASEYIELRNNRYVWNLNRNDAIQIGLSREQIEQIRSDIESANQQIIIWEEQNTPHFLTDPQNKIVFFMNTSESTDITSNLEIIRLKTGDESNNMPSGTIFTNGQKWGSDGGWVPIGAKKANYSCRSNAALTPVYNVKLKNFGNERVGGGIGALGVISTFSLSLFASNTSFEVSFATTDSNGGSCNWSLSE